MTRQISREQISAKELFTKMIELYRYLLVRWKIILLFGIMGAALGLTYSLMNKPVYTATLTFALEDDDKGGLSGAFGLGNQFGFDLGQNGGGKFSNSKLI